MVLRKELILLVFGLCSYFTHSQQPWVKEPGKGYWQTGISNFTYGRVYNSQGQFNTPIARTVSESVLSQYIELGIFKRTMITAQLPLHLITTGNVAKTWVLPTLPKGSGIGFGNIYSALTVNLLKKGGFVLSTSFGTYFNSSIRKENVGIQTGYNATGFEPKLLAGLGLKNHFFAFGAGANFRTNNYSHQLKLDAKWGSKMGKKKRGWFIVGLTNCIPLNKKTAIENFVTDFTAQETFLYLNEQSFIAFNLTWGLELEKWSGWLSFGGGPGWNVGMGAPISLSIGRKLNLKKTKQVEEKEG